MVTIIDYGVGNIGSIANMLKRLNEESVITSDVNLIRDATGLVLCGIGAFDDGMTRLEQMGVVDVLNQKVLIEKTPILGICLGMQLFTEGSEEGVKKGLGFVKGRTRRLQLEKTAMLKVPHMGWNNVKQTKKSDLLTDMYPDPRFYFVHSYHVQLEQNADELLTCDYGYSFTAAFEHENVIGVQFHPEKSHKFGIKLFENFVKYY
ncbi:MAG: imidazole glycerol phosphate synthase subunit HisH [Bacteroidia bacterium]